MNLVNTSCPKVDSMALVTGKPVYTDDLAPKDCLIVKVLRSPHAHAKIRKIETERALKVPGIECVLTHEDCSDKRFTMAGQTYPEPSPYDRRILDDRVRFVGDAVAVIAGVSEKAVAKAMKLVKVDYEVLEPVLDFRKAKDHEILVHPEENWKALCEVGADNKRNLCARSETQEGDIDQVLKDCKYYVEETYHTKAKPAGYDGKLLYVYAYGRIWKAQCGVLHAGYIPCEKNPVQRPGYSKVKNPSGKAEDWRRLWGEADGGQERLSGPGDHEDRKARKDRLHKRRIFHRIQSAA